MTVESIKARVKEIEAEAWDDEAAHCSEDDLYYAFVDFVAATASEPLKTMASELRKVRDIEFSRWHA